MSAKFRMHMEATGERKEFPARRFSHYVNNVRFWFALHKDVSRNGLTVSHWDSGKRVCDVPINTQLACLGDEKAAAKMALDKLCEKYPKERVYGVLLAAEREAAGA